MKHTYALSAIGADRPGIAADVAGMIYECGGNLEDSSMTILGNQFALLILLSGSGEEFQFCLSTRCKKLEWEKHLAIFLTPVEETDRQSKPGGAGESYELVTTGQDRMGIVFHISRLLADLAINIADMHTRVTPSPESGSPIFTMVIKLQAPPDVARADLRERLNRLEEKLAVDISLKKTGDAE